MTQSLSSVYQFRKTGSRQFLLPGQIYRSPGLAKIAPWWLVRRDYFSAKVPGLVSADGATNVYSLNRRAVSIYAGANFSGQITNSMTIFASMTDRTNANSKPYTSIEIISVFCSPLIKCTVTSYYVFTTGTHT